MYDYPPNSVYFLTGSTFLHYPYFKDLEEKLIVLEAIKKLKKDKKIQICAYSIQINHYHLVFYSRAEKDVAVVKQYMHGGVSHRYTILHGKVQTEFWGTYKIIRIFSQEMYWKIVGYVNGNLLKHHEVGTFDELKRNQFSSYGHFANKYGDEMMKGVVYKVIDIGEGAEGEVDIDEMKKCYLRSFPN